MPSKCGTARASCCAICASRSSARSPVPLAAVAAHAMVGKTFGTDDRRGERSECSGQFGDGRRSARRRSSCPCVTPAWAQISDDVVKIGVLNDQSGVYADLGGPARSSRRAWRSRISAARCSASRSRSSTPTTRTRPISAPRSRADGSTSRRSTWRSTSPIPRWRSQSSNCAKERNRIAIADAVGTTDFTGKACSPTAAALDLRQLRAHHQPGARGDRAGRDSWFFLTVDYAFGHSLEARRHARRRWRAAARCWAACAIRSTTPTSRSFLLQAQSSGRQGRRARQWRRRHDQRHEAGQRVRHHRRRSVAGVAAGLHHRRPRLGLQAAQGRFRHRVLLGPRRRDARLGQALLRAVQGDADHGAGQRLFRDPHYLRADRCRRHRRGQGGDGQDARIAGRRFLRARARLRADGRLVHDMYLAQVKKPSESKAPWDYYKILGTIPGDQAFQSLEQGGCPLAQQH